MTEDPQLPVDTEKNTPHEKPISEPLPLVSNIEEAPTWVVMPEMPEIPETLEPPPPEPKKPPSDPGLLQVAKIVSLLTGGFVALSGLCVGLLGAIGLFVTSEKVTATDSIAVIGLFITGFIFGTALAWQAGQSWRKIPSKPFRLPPIWLWCGIYLLVLIGGQSLVMLKLWPAIFLPPFHFMGALFPVVLILAVVKYFLPPPHITWRDLILAMSGGILLAPLIAVSVELIGGLIIFVIALIGMAIMPDGQSQIETWAQHLQDPVFVKDPDNLMTLATFPPVVITLVLVLIVVGPIIEELTKPISVYLVSYRRLTKPQAWLWGLAGGAGFALWENIFNTLTSLEAWGLVMVIRIGASLMHCLGSGLIALGWQSMVTSRRPWYLLGAITVSISLHALWNTTVIGIVGSALMSPETLKPIVGIGILLAALFLVAVVVAMSGALVGITMRLAQEAKNNLIVANLGNE